MNDHQIVVAGGGPTGLMLAAELALAGVDVAIVERRPNQHLPGSRAGGLAARTIEVFDQRGIADRFLTEGQPAQVAAFARVPLDISDFPTRHPYGLGLWQNHIERILADWVAELAVTFYRATNVIGHRQDADGVDVQLDDGRTVRAQYLIGCDGGRSIVRKSAGIDFPGAAPTTSSLIGEVEVMQQPTLGLHRDALGQHAFGRVDYEIRDGQVVFADDGPVTFMVTEAELGTDEPTLERLREALIAVYGTDYGAHSPIWISRFTDAARQAATYRTKRVFLAGDAAHIHPPDGGQGLNTGVQDAVNLGWKLALVVQGRAPESLLDTYHAERHPVGALVLRNAMASSVLRRPDQRTAALQGAFADMLAMDEPRRHFAAIQSGLGLRYDLGNGHPLLGRRMPDLDLELDEGVVRTFTLLHMAKPVVVNFGAAGHVTVAGWSDRVRLVDARYDGVWDLPAVGEVPAPNAVLVRPDGYVAWVGSSTDDGLRDALAAWFGPPDNA